MRNQEGSFELEKNKMDEAKFGSCRILFHFYSLIIIITNWNSKWSVCLQWLSTIACHLFVCFDTTYSPPTLPGVGHQWYQRRAGPGRGSGVTVNRSLSTSGSSVQKLFDCPKRSGRFLGRIGGFPPVGFANPKEIPRVHSIKSSKMIGLGLYNTTLTLYYI